MYTFTPERVDVIKVSDSNGGHVGYLYERSINIPDLVVENGTVFRQTAGNYYQIPIMNSGWITDYLITR